jgi:hypothetical protein
MTETQYDGQSVEELIAAGYFVISRKHRIIARVDLDPEALERWARRDLSGSMPAAPGVSAGQRDFYRRVHSNDRMRVPQDVLTKIPSSILDQGDTRLTPKPVVLESPFAVGDGYTNAQAVTYLDECLLDSLSRGESPYASHAILPLVLDENDPVQRQRGIDAGYSWQDVAEGIVFYIDLGWSGGMASALSRVRDRGLNYTVRRIR